MLHLEPQVLIDYLFVFVNLNQVHLILFINWNAIFLYICYNKIYTFERNWSFMKNNSKWYVIKKSYLYLIKSRKYLRTNLFASNLIVQNIFWQIIDSESRNVSALWQTEVVNCSNGFRPWHGRYKQYWNDIFEF